MTTERADLLAVLDGHGLIPADVIAVLSVGSLARGWASERSDYNFHIISSAAWRGERSASLTVPLRPQTVPVKICHEGGRCWEVKFWIDFQVDQMLSKVTWSKFENGRSPTRVLTEAEELFLERLATCLPLQGGEWVDRRRRDLAATAYRAFAVTRSLCEADWCVEDALGQLADDDPLSATLSARKALGHVVDALLESYGDYGSRTPKWRARRFRAVAPRELSFELDAAAEFIFKQIDGVTTLRQIAERIAAAYRVTVGEALAGGSEFLGQLADLDMIHISTA